MKHILHRIICLVLLVGMLLACLVGCGIVETPPAGENPPSGDGGGDTPDNPTYELFINELCADNKGSQVISGQEYDWIELYNPTRQDMDISGFYLTDSGDNLPDYGFPDGTVIEAKGYLLIYAVGEADFTEWTRREVVAPFKLSEDGEEISLYTSNGTLVDTVFYSAIHMKDEEVTYARITDGDDEWGEANPTPAKTNKGSSRVLSSSIMTFSHESGFYDEAFSLSISVPTGYRVYYTVDCSDPRTSDTAIRWDKDSPIQVYDPSSSPDRFSSIQVTDGYMYVPGDPVDKCFIVRAHVENAKGNRSRVVTKTFFVGYENKDGYTDIPVISLTADPDALYGENGLFINSNWGHNPSANRWEIEADFTFIDENRTFGFRQNVGVRIRGTSTRGLHQKNLNIFARSQYDGNAAFIDPLFEGVTETKSLVLRGDGMNDLNVGQGYLQDLASDREISTQQYYPVVVFLDGEYYGIYNMYERFSEDYVEAHYGVDSQNVWIVKKGGAPSMIESNCSEAESDYTELMHFICNVGQYNDLSKSSTYKKLEDWVDMQSLADILAVQLYIGNEDFSISQNITAWRSADVDPNNPYADGRWRFVIYDLDYTLVCSATIKYDYDYDPFTQDQPYAGKGFLYWAYNWNERTPFTQNLMKSKTFRDLFAATFEEVATQDYSYDRVEEIVEDCIQRLLPNMVNFINRYHAWYTYNPERMEQEFRNKMAPDLNYLQKRAEYVIGYMRNALGISTASVSEMPDATPALYTAEEKQYGI